MKPGAAKQTLGFLAGALTKPAATFAAARGVRFWRAAYLACLVSVALEGLGSAIHDDNGGLAGAAYLLLLSPLIAGVPLLIALLASRVALAVARERGGDGDYLAAATQAAIVTAVCAVPANLVQLAFGPSPAMPFTFVSLIAYVYLAFLYSGAFRVTVGRGLAGAVVGTLALLAGLVSIAIVIVVLLQVSGVPVP